MHIIITGDPVCGFEFSGPFRDGQAAIAYADKHQKSLGPQYWTSALNSIDDPDGEYADVATADDSILVELTREQGDMVRYLTWEAAKNTDDQRQVDYLVKLSSDVLATMRACPSLEQVVFDFTTDDADMIRSLIYEAINRGVEHLPPETADLDDLVDQFEQCMDEDRDVVYEVTGYRSQDEFDSRQFCEIAGSLCSKRDAMKIGRASLAEYPIVKVRSNDLEFIEILRR